jgi:hypothetical protein
LDGLGDGGDSAWQMSTEPPKKMSKSRMKTLVVDFFLQFEKTNDEIFIVILLSIAIVYKNTTMRQFKLLVKSLS